MRRSIPYGRVGFAHVADGRIEEASAIIAPAADWSLRRSASTHHAELAAQPL